MDYTSVQCPCQDQCAKICFPSKTITNYENFTGSNQDTSPPPAPQLDGNWELQFCKWWGWTWVKKESKQLTTTHHREHVSIEPKEPVPKPQPHKKKKKGGCLPSCCKKKKKRSSSTELPAEPAPPPPPPKPSSRADYHGNECCMCCPCMQQSCCPCMSMQHYDMHSFYQGGGPPQPQIPKQVQCNLQCVNNVNTQTQPVVPHFGGGMPQWGGCCGCPCQGGGAGHMQGGIRPQRLSIHADTQTPKPVQHQGTTISHANIPKMMKKYRECNCRCVNRFSRPMCCPCASQQRSPCCPCIITSDPPKTPKTAPPTPKSDTNNNNNNTKTTEEVIANWLTSKTSCPALNLDKYKTSPIEKPTKSIDLLIKNNMNLMNLLGTEKYLKLQKPTDITTESNETISFLNSNCNLDHSKLLTKVCDAILSGNLVQDKKILSSNNSSKAHIPTILSDKSLHEAILKDTQNPHLNKILTRSDKGMNLNHFNSILLQNDLVSSVKLNSPKRSKLNITTNELSKAETIEELINAMDSTFSKDVLDNIETTLNK